MPRRAADAGAALLGCVLVLLALALIWSARLSVGRELYVSELGATGEPTALIFRNALMLIVLGGSLIAFASRGIRSRLRFLRVWSPAVSLWAASGLFLVASQVTCTSGCPVPWGVFFTWQDFTHIVCAVLAFAAACLAMLQASFAHEHPYLAVFSRVACASVALIAATGGILSLAGVATGLGGRLELVATTLAIGWVAVYGAAIGRRHLAEARSARTDATQPG